MEASQFACSNHARVLAMLWMYSVVDTGFDVSKFTVYLSFPLDFFLISLKQIN